MSSPRLDKCVPNPNDTSYFHLSNIKNDGYITKEKPSKATPFAKNYPPETVLNNKGFSPILTPHRHNKVLVGESALRTPNSKIFASGDKKSPVINTPDYKFSN